MTDLKHQELVEQIDALLPQTQCGRCGYKACLPYAEAIALKQAEINQCPPGGAPGITALAQLLGLPVIPLNPHHGSYKPAEIAFIIEENCIGCVKCIAVCPVDAILGAAKLMHTVIANECTGCELCVPACPVDCIKMQPMPLGIERVTRSKARQRYEARSLRKQQQANAKLELAMKKKKALYQG